jgi:hypothetical protein
LWESSGQGYYGYNDPTEVAAEMLESAIKPFVQEAKKCHELEKYPAAYARHKRKSGAAC